MGDFQMTLIYKDHVFDKIVVEGRTLNMTVVLKHLEGFMKKYISKLDKEERVKIEKNKKSDDEDFHKRSMLVNVKNDQLCYILPYERESFIMFTRVLPPLSFPKINEILGESEYSTKLFLAKLSKGLSKYVFSYLSFADSKIVGKINKTFLHFFINNFLKNKFTKKINLLDFSTLEIIKKYTNPNQHGVYKYFYFYKNCFICIIAYKNEDEIYFGELSNEDNTMSLICKVPYSTSILIENRLYLLNYNGSKIILPNENFLIFHLKWEQDLSIEYIHCFESSFIIITDTHLAFIAEQKIKFQNLTYLDKLEEFDIKLQKKQKIFWKYFSYGNILIYYCENFAKILSFRGGKIILKENFSFSNKISTIRKVTSTIIIFELANNLMVCFETILLKEIYTFSKSSLINFQCRSLENEPHSFRWNQKLEDIYSEKSTIFQRRNLTFTNGFFYEFTINQYSEGSLIKNTQFNYSSSRNSFNSLIETQNNFHLLISVEKEWVQIFKNLENNAEKMYNLSDIYQKFDENIICKMVQLKIKEQTYLNLYFYDKNNYQLLKIMKKVPERVFFNEKVICYSRVMKGF